MKRIPTQAEWVQRYGKPTLILPIKGYWLNKILRGEKPEEYREIKPYYERILEKYRHLKSFTVGFRAGYSLDSPMAVCLCNLQKGEGFEEWGAEEGKRYYIFRIMKVYNFF